MPLAASTRTAWTSEPEGSSNSVPPLEDGARSWGRPGGQPGGSSSLSGQPAAITYEENGQPVVLVFACASGGGGLKHLEWSNDGWHWVEHGSPPGPSIKTEVISRPVKATALRLPSGQLWRVAVAHGANGHLYSRLLITGAGGWNWQDLRTPPGGARAIARHQHVGEERQLHRHRYLRARDGRPDLADRHRTRQHLGRDRNARLTVTMDPTSARRRPRPRTASAVAGVRRDRYRGPVGPECGMYVSMSDSPDEKRYTDVMIGP